jgi:hypothetical protein
MISVTAVHDGEAVGTTEHMLSAAEVVAQRVEVNVVTSVKASTSTLVVTGTAFLEDSTIPVPSGLAVTVMNGANGMEASGMTDENGMYNVTFFSPDATVAEAGDTLTITITKTAQSQLAQA